MFVTGNGSAYGRAFRGGITALPSSAKTFAQEKNPTPGGRGNFSHGVVSLWLCCFDTIGSCGWELDRRAAKPLSNKNWLIVKYGAWDSDLKLWQNDGFQIGFKTRGDGCDSGTLEIRLEHFCPHRRPTAAAKGASRAATVVDHGREESKARGDSGVGDCGIPGTG